MVKKREAKTSTRPTRKQIARTRKEQEQLNLIYRGLGLVAVLIVIVLAFGLIQTYVIQPNSAIATVNEEKITNREYEDRLTYERFLLIESLFQIQQELSKLPPAEEGDQFTEMIRNQYQQFNMQIQQQLATLDSQVVDTMIADKLVGVEVQKRGITVSEEDVTEAINRILAGRAGGLTAQSALETSTAQAEASTTAASWTPTPTFTPLPTLETTAEITQPTATPANTPTPAPTPTLNIIAEGTLTTEYATWLNRLSDEADTSEQEYRQFIIKSLLRTKLGEALGAEVPNIAKHSHARHILVETEDEANEVIERLNSGQDFAELAEELSQDPGSAAKGGDLDFVPRGGFVPTMDEAIFTLPIAEISEPIESQFGWHIVEVLKREDRELSPADYSQKQRLAYSDWLAEARNAATIENFWIPESASNN